MGRLPKGRQEAACKKDLKPRPFLHSMVQSNIIEWCRRIKKPVFSRLPAVKNIFIICGIFGVGESKKAFPYFGIFGEVRPAEKAPGFWAQFYAGNPPTFTVYIIPLRYGYQHTHHRRRRSRSGYAIRTRRRAEAGASHHHAGVKRGRTPAHRLPIGPAGQPNAQRCGLHQRQAGTARTQGAGADSRATGRGDTDSKRAICANSAQLYEKAHFSAGEQAKNLDKIKEMYKFQKIRTLC